MLTNSIEAKSWRSLYGSDPPEQIHRQLLTQAIAHRLQVKALGGINFSTRRGLKKITKETNSYKAEYQNRKRNRKQNGTSPAASRWLHTNLFTGLPFSKTYAGLLVEQRVVKGEGKGQRPAGSKSVSIYVDPTTSGLAPSGV
jgi:hypothetical protein